MSREKNRAVALVEQGDRQRVEKVYSCAIREIEACSSSLPQWSSRGA